MRGWFAILLLLGASNTQADESLPRLINERLSMMQQVAAYKWHRKLPVADPVREAVVLRAATIDGLRRNITKAASQNFYRAQIEAAKDIQQCWFTRWETDGQAPVAPDLIKTIRPALLALGTRISRSLGDGDWATDGFNEAISIDCLSDEARDDIRLALTGLKRYEDRLEQITDSGILRVGTTGDYPPFSHSNDGRRFTGVDIDLARSFANSLRVTFLPIKTSWPTLTRDFQDGAYDIAMSGVSISDKRREIAYFSMPYHRGGKTPITLCANADRFHSLEVIDKPGVRIIVNPGGTNEKFVDHNIHHASKLLHDDNRTIFSQIINGSADLMITDSIEVRLQSALHPSLCGSMPDQTLTVLEKAFMMPKEKRIKESVDLWLQNELQSGNVKRLFEKHLQPTTGHTDG